MLHNNVTSKNKVIRILVPDSMFCSPDVREDKRVNGRCQYCELRAAGGGVVLQLCDAERTDEDRAKINLQEALCERSDLISVDGTDHSLADPMRRSAIQMVCSMISRSSGERNRQGSWSKQCRVVKRHHGAG